MVMMQIYFQPIVTKSVESAKATRYIVLTAFLPIATPADTTVEYSVHILPTVQRCLSKIILWFLRTRA